MEAESNNVHETLTKQKNKPQRCIHSANTLGNKTTMLEDNFYEEQNIVFVFKKSFWSMLQS